jgi:hypothetical protein
MKLTGFLIMAMIEKAGVSALCGACTAAVIIFLLAGFFIWRRRHQFFDRDLEVDNNVPVVRDNRQEAIILSGEV